MVKTQAFAGAIQQTARRALADVIADEGFRILVARSLEHPPYALNGKGGLRVAPLVLGAYQAAGGADGGGLQPATAMEFLFTSLHLLDGLADGDVGATSADLQVSMTLQTTMWFLLGRTPSPSGAPVDWSPVLRLLATVCSGQQRDLDSQGVSAPTMDDARTMTLQKAGAFGRAMMVCGALAAGAPAGLLEDLGTVGECLGMHGQASDDAADASPAKSETSDIRLRKKTIPIVFFLDAAGDDPGRDVLRMRFNNAEPLSLTEEMTLRRAVDESGGVEMASLLGSWYKMKAADILERLRSTGCKTQYLDDHLGRARSQAKGSGGALAR